MCRKLINKGNLVSEKKGIDRFGRKFSIKQFDKQILSVSEDIMKRRKLSSEELENLKNNWIRVIQKAVDALKAFGEAVGKIKLKREIL